MKKLAIALGLSSLFAASAFANTGYSGPGATDPVKTAATALQAKDDTHVVLEGHLSQKLENERYIFKDDSGTINVEIDDDKLPVGGVNDKTRVRLTGEVDKGLTATEVDVDVVEVLAP